MTDTTARRRDLYGLLGDLPARDRPISAGLVTTREEPGYLLDTLILDLNGIEAVPAYLTLPRAAPRPLPAVVYSHAHGGDYVRGKDELLQGSSYLRTPPYAVALARMGVAALCIDHWNFGERRGRSESELFKHLLWHGQVLWGLMVYDTLRATDYLVARPEIDPARVGTMGLSMGSTMAWWHAALDERVAACVDLCCLTDFRSLLETRGLDGHGLYYYVPGLLRHFDTAAINALTCPRPHLSLAGELDRLTPPAGLDRIDRALREVYGAAGVPEHWELVRYRTGHFENWDMRRRVLAFLRTHLRTESDPERER